MIEGLLKKVGITPETASAAAGAVANELKLIAGDALAGAVEMQVSKVVRPVLADIRKQLLAAIADEPPKGFAIRLRLRGYEITDDQVRLLWADVIATLAEQPAKEAGAA